MTDMDLIREIYFTDLANSAASFHAAFKQYGHFGVIMSLDLINETIQVLQSALSKARMINDYQNRMVVVKSITAILMLVQINSQQDELLSLEDYEEKVCRDIASISNIIYFVRNKVFYNKNVQLFMLLPSSKYKNTRGFEIYASVAASGEERLYWLGCIFLVAEDNEFIFKVVDDNCFDGVKRLRLKVENNIQSIELYEANGQYSVYVDTDSWHDRHFSAK